MKWCALWRDSVDLRWYNGRKRGYDDEGVGGGEEVEGAKAKASGKTMDSPKRVRGPCRGILAVSDRPRAYF